MFLTWKVDVMAVWMNVVATCPHDLKLDVWYAEKQKRIVRFVPHFTYKENGFAVVHYCGKSYDVVIAEISISMT